MAASVARRGFQSPDSGTKAHAWDGVAGTQAEPAHFSQKTHLRAARQSLSTVLLEVRREDGGQLGGLGLAGAAGSREVNGGDSVADPYGFESHAT